MNHYNLLSLKVKRHGNQNFAFTRIKSKYSTQIDEDYRMYKSNRLTKYAIGLSKYIIGSSKYTLGILSNYFVKFFF